VSEIDSYKKALDLEFRTQVRDSLQLMELSVAERVETSRTVGGLIYQGVDGRRTAHHVFYYQGAPGKFRTGDYALLSPSDPEPRGALVRKGTQVVIDRIDASAIVVQCGRADIGEPFARGVPYVLDERPPEWFPNFQRLSLALALAEYCMDPGERLRKLLAGELPIEATGSFPDTPPDLAGERARTAFQWAVERNLTAVQGPPGTGKTYLLARIARAFVQRGYRVLLCAFTHRAINNALGAMVAAGIPTQALGKVPGSDESDLPAGVERLDKREYWKRPREGFVAAMTVHAAFEPFHGPLLTAGRTGRDSRPLREGQSEEAFWQQLNRYNRNVVQRARLPGPSGLADVVIFDEASQLTVPMALCALASAPRAVFFGDHAQLPPVNVAQESGAYPSIFHLAAERYPQAFVRLNESYRMNGELCAFPSGQFYEDDLAPVAAVFDRQLEPKAISPLYGRVLAPAPASLFVEVNHVGQGQESPLEACLVADMALEALQCGLADAKEGLAILAPHRRQNNAIRMAFERLAAVRGVPPLIARRWLDELVIDTVDRMQGQERDVILYSLTASDDGVMESEREFLFLPNRFNVAITRARKKLVVVGSRQFFHHLPHALLHAEWHGEPGDRTRRMIQDANVFKAWYLKHRHAAVDLTEHAATLF
jgi:hypothetical protein